MDDARREQERFAQSHPDEKPPWVDGCLFASLFEGPDRFEIVGSEPQADGTTRLTVRFGYRDAPAWQDAVIVARDGERWVIDDFVFSGAGQFNAPGRLSDSLTIRDE